jgi:hypothetical protein
MRDSGCVQTNDPAIRPRSQAHDDDVVIEPGPAETLYRAIRHTDAAVAACKRCLPVTHPARRAVDDAIILLHDARRLIESPAA